MQIRWVEDAVGKHAVAQPTAISPCNPYDKQQQNNKILIYVSPREQTPGPEGKLLERWVNIQIL